MSKREQFSCRTCGNIVTVETITSSDKIEFRIDDGTPMNGSSGLHVECGVCCTRVLGLALKQD